MRRSGRRSSAGAYRLPTPVLRRHRKHAKVSTMDRRTFLEAAERHGIAAVAAAALYEDLFEAPAPTPLAPLARPTEPFAAQTQLTRTVQLLAWLGTLLLIGAHAWWSTKGYESIGIGVVLTLTLVWQTAFLGAAEWARRARVVTLEAGFAAIVAFYTPLAAYSVERLLGFEFRSNDFDDFYPYVSGGWVWMELAAIAAAILLLIRYRRPFLALPLTLFTGFLAMDGATRALGGWEHQSTVQHAVLAVGIAILATGVALDYRGWRRFAFWPHIASVWLVAWGLDGLCGGRHALALFIAAALALALGVWLARTTYLIAGGLLGWAAVGVSAHGAAFPFLLMLGGLVFVSFAVWLARSDSRVRRWLSARSLPAPQRDLAY
jgi:hypothetical protein